MKSIGVSNLRSLRNINMELSTVNILVGKNSSGKSTFLRIFPLIKQSINKKLSAPIFWGDENSDVDFDSLRTSCVLDEDFILKFKTAITNPAGFWNSAWGEEIKNKEIEIELELYISNVDDYKDYIKKYNLFFLGRKVEIIFDEQYNVEKYIIDGSEYKRDSDILSEKYNSKAIFNEYINSDINFAYDMFTSKVNINRNSSQNYPEGMVYYLDEIKVFMYALFNHRYLGLEKSKIWKGITLNKDEYNKLNNVIDSSDLEVDEILFLNIVDNVLQTTMRRIKAEFELSIYIAPIRSIPSRYHRITNVAINEVDAKGENIAMVLNSLSEQEVIDLKEFMNKYLGFSVSLEREKGNLSIVAEEKDSKIRQNIIDTGSGYSQILPIAIQLWKTQKAISEKMDKCPITILMEQPELHLHPALQAKLIDLIINIANNQKGKLVFLLETHSDIIVNRIGELIYKEKIDNDSVSVNIFSKEEDVTQLEVVKYDKDGYLENWPIGFFTPETVE